MGFRDTDIDKLLIAGLIADAADAAARRSSGRDALAAAHTGRRRRQAPKPTGKRRFALLRRRLPNA
jgi:hypothetical protein